jgi:release factor glutamine methyltransferase
MPADGFTRGSQLHRRHLEDPAPPDEFELLGRRWTLLRDVFSPVYTPVTELFTTWLPLPDGGSVLEMGSGAGVTAVTAALAGCTVTALDIAEAAVENTRVNAVRHGVAERVDVRQSDLFGALGADERFDLIYWNSNFALAPSDHVPESDFELAFVDAGYETHRRFLAEAGQYLEAGGRVLLGFSDIGSWPELRAGCRAAGLEPVVVRSEKRELEVPIEFQLVEVRPV